MSAADLARMVATMPPAASSAQDLSGGQKAAAVLLAVGPELAAGVLAHLDDSEVERMALEVAQLGEVAPERMNAVLAELQHDALAQQYIVSGGEAYARSMLRRWRGAEADAIVDRLLASVQSAPFGFLQAHEPAEVLQHLQEEHPQTLALILAHLPAKFAAQVLAGLDPELQADVALRVATIDRTAPETVTQVERALQARLGSARSQRQLSEAGGVRELASMLNNADRGTERAILANLEASDPQVAEQVRALMFVFEDIVTLDDRAVQEVLRHVDVKRLALALKGVREDVRSAITRNLSERAAQALAEEVEVLGPVRLRDVEAAQSEVVGHIRRLDEEGTILIGRGRDGGEVVE